MDHLEPGDTLRCQCTAGSHGHTAGGCEYNAIFLITPSADIPHLPQALKVCSPCEAQWVKIEPRKE